MIRYLVGDATAPVGAGKRVIAHVCNNVGAWGAGFVLAVSKRWTKPELVYRDAFRVTPRPELGEVQRVTVAPDLIVANMIAQDGFPSRARQVAIDYAALETCLRSLTTLEGYSFHMPRIGCGIAGGDWETIHSIIKRTIGLADVCVYDLPSSS